MAVVAWQGRVQSRGEMQRRCASQVNDVQQHAGRHTSAPGLVQTTDTACMPMQRCHHKYSKRHEANRWG